MPPMKDASVAAEWMALFLLQVRDPIPGASMQFSTLIIFISEQLSSMEGGPNLAQDRLALPILTESDHGSIRCQTGSAVITGPNSYDKLLTMSFTLLGQTIGISLMKKKMVVTEIVRESKRLTNFLLLPTKAL